MAIFVGPDHSVRAARAALELQVAMAPLADAHPAWPRLRVGVNTGRARCARWAATATSPTRSTATA